MENLLVNVEPEKKDRIINSAMKEFTTNSFQKASTNTIIKEAGISKGLLFHYFGSKDKLYKYLEYFSIHIIAEAIMNELDWEESDIFLRLYKISIIKFEVMQKYPYLMDFSLLVFKDKTADELIHTNPEFSLTLYSQIYTKNINYSLFKEEIDVKKAVNIIQWTLEKCNDNFRQRIASGQMKKDYRIIEKEVFGYINILKDSFYK